MSSKVLRHPDKEEIIKKLVEGESVKAVEEWLQKKYPKTKRLHISFVTLQNFRKEHLNLHGALLEDLKNTRTGQSQKEANRAETRAALADSNAYQKALEEIVSNEIDVTRKMVELEKVISLRIEYYFNVLSSGDISVKEEKVFIDLLNAQRSLMQDWKKYIEGVADKKIEHNINIRVMNEQITILKNIVYETLKELDPTLVPIFLDKINDKLNLTEYGDSNYQNYQIGVIDADYEE